MTVRRSAPFPIIASLATALFTANGTAQEAIVIGSWCDGSSGSACDAAFRVDLATGQRTMISAYTQEDAARDATAGNSGSAESRNRSGTLWNGVAVTPAGAIFVMAAEHQNADLRESLYRVDPATGDRQWLSSLVDSSFGPVIGSGTSFTRLVATPEGTLLAHERSADGGAILAIDLQTGKRNVFSDPTDSNQGPAFNYFLGLDPNGRIFATETGTPDSEALLQIDPRNGKRSILSQLPAGTTGTRGQPAFACGAGSDTPEGGLKGAGNRLYCSEQLNFNDRRFSLDTLDTITGVRSVLSAFGDTAQGPVVGSPRGQTWGADGRLLLLDDGDANTEGLGAILAIDPDTGARTSLSDFNNPAQGALIYNAKAFAAVPPATAVTPGTPGSPGRVGQPSTTGAAGELSQSDSTDPVQVNQPYAYTITFTNPGSGPATKVKLTDKLPGKSKLVSVTASQGTCRGKSKISCNIGTVAPGATVTVNIGLTTRKSGNYRNRVRVNFKASPNGSSKSKRFTLVATEATTVTP